MKIKKFEMLALVEFIFGLFFAPLCFAENYYALTEHQIKGKSGTVYAMQTITKTSEEAACKKIAGQKSTSFGQWISSGSECFNGGVIVVDQSSWDDWVRHMFENAMTSYPYISFSDLYGFPTRVKFVRLTGQDSPVPGFPVDIPTEQVLPLANAVIKSLEASGIKNAKIIYPESKAS